MVSLPGALIGAACGFFFIFPATVMWMLKYQLGHKGPYIHTFAVTTATNKDIKRMYILFVIVFAILGGLIGGKLGLF